MFIHKMCYSTSGDDIGALMISDHHATPYLPINENAVFFWKPGTEQTLSFPSKEKDDIVWGLALSAIKEEEWTEVLVGLSECCGLSASSENE